MSDWAQRIEQGYSGAVYDVLRAMGHTEQALPAGIRPMHSETKLAGQIYTVEGRYEEGIDPHETLLEWTGMLSKAPAGSVVICQPNDDRLAHMGELSAETMQLRGIRGYIVDGGCRDSAFVSSIGFKVFCRYYTPVDVVGRWLPEAFGAPITIGGVTIHTGDYVMADRDGVVIIPEAHIKELTEQVEEVLSTESKVRKAIKQGMDPQQAYLKYGKF